jgi:hypothetical protein
MITVFKSVSLPLFYVFQRFWQCRNINFFLDIAQEKKLGAGVTLKMQLPKYGLPVGNQTSRQLRGCPVPCRKTTSGTSTSRWRTLAKHPRGAKTLFCFFLKMKPPPPPPHCIGDCTFKHVHLGNIRTLFSYVARIFTFLQTKINYVLTWRSAQALDRHFVQTHRTIAILYRKTHRTTILMNFACILWNFTTFD